MHARVAATPKFDIGELNQLARGELGPELRSITIAELMGSGPVSGVLGAGRQRGASVQPKTRRKAGTIHVVGTATSDYGVFNVDVSL